MAIDDKLTDLMAARLSKGKDLDLIYTNPKNHIVCFIPTYQPSGQEWRLDETTTIKFPSPNGDHLI